MSVVMKAKYGVEYVVAENLTVLEAVQMRDYVLATCDEDYFDNLMVDEVVIR